MKAIYIDKDIIVCEKPYGVSSQASEGENMLDLIARQVGVTPFVVHRLDVTTTGLMVYALNERCASALCEQIASRSFEKEYLAIVHGHAPECGEMVDFLYHDRLKNKSFAIKSKRQGAKEARLEFRTLAYASLDGDELSLVKIKLLTGRTHQIRVQFSSRGFCLWGDGKYGARDNDKIALYSHSIAFSHPKTKEKMSFSSFPEKEGIWSAFENDL